MHSYRILWNTEYLGHIPGSHTWVTYLGHIVDKKGLHTIFQKVEAVKLAPVPKNQQDLRSFLGLVHYYGKFIASLLLPLNELLKARKL